MQLLTREFYARDTLTVARALLGQHIVRKLPDGTQLVCRITETEAYMGPIDKACHAYGGQAHPAHRDAVRPAGDGLSLFDLRHVPLPQLRHRAGGGALRGAHPGAGVPQGKAEALMARTRYGYPRPNERSAQAVS